MIIVEDRADAVIRPQRHTPRRFEPFDLGRQIICGGLRDRVRPHPVRAAAEMIEPLDRRTQRLNAGVGAGLAPLDPPRHQIQHLRRYRVRIRNICASAVNVDQVGKGLPDAGARIALIADRIGRATVGRTRCGGEPARIGLGRQKAQRRGIDLIAQIGRIAGQSAVPASGESAGPLTGGLPCRSDQRPIIHPHPPLHPVTARKGSRKKGAACRCADSLRNSPRMPRPAAMAATGQVRTAPAKRSSAAAPCRCRRCRHCA